MKTVFRVPALWMLVLALVLFNCKGEEGDVGPKGDTGAAGQAGAQGPAGPAGPAGQNAAQLLENGFIKGTLKGKRRDGTAFEEAFEYKLADDTYGFSKVGTTLHELYVSRVEDLIYSGWADMNLLIENKGQANQMIRLGDSYNQYGDGFDINFQKLLPNKSLLKLEAQALFEPDEVRLPMSRASNATYKLVNYGRDPESIHDSSNGDFYLIFNDEAGNRIYFIDSENNPNYNYEFSYLINSSGQKVTTSATFGNLVVDSYHVHNEHTFHTNQGTDLSEIIDVPADTYEITNFIHDAATGIVTFDYKLNIQQFRRTNTSRNPLEITGSVRADVYNEVVMRKSAE